MKYTSYSIHLPMKMEPIVSSETSAIRTQTPGNYPKRNKFHLEHGERLKTRNSFIHNYNYIFAMLMLLFYEEKEKETDPGDQFRRNNYGK